jgi:hypothetical protein
MFFSEEKNQKTFMSAPAMPTWLYAPDFARVAAAVNQATGSKGDLS